MTEDEITITEFKRRVLPVYHTILEMLSASDASSFMYAIGARVNNTSMERYMNVVRDIPEHMNWINKMVSEGNKVMLVGSDLYRMQQRILHPGTYDRTNKKRMCIWLAVVPTEALQKDIENKYVNPHRMNRNAEIKTISEVSNLRMNHVIPDRTVVAGTSAMLANWEPDSMLSTMLIFPPKTSATVTQCNPQNRWLKSTLENDNGVTVIFFYSRNTDNGVLCSRVSEMIPQRHIITNSSRSSTLMNDCYVQLTGEPAEGTSSWSVPIISSRNDDMSTDLGSLWTMWYDVSSGVIGRSYRDRYSNNKTSIPGYMPLMAIIVDDNNARTKYRDKIVIPIKYH